MANATIYIQTTNEDRWKKIKNRSQLVNYILATTPEEELKQLEKIAKKASK